MTAAEVKVSQKGATGRGRSRGWKRTPGAPRGSRRKRPRPCGVRTLTSRTVSSEVRAGTALRLWGLVTAVMGKHAGDVTNSVSGVPWLIPSRRAAGAGTPAGIQLGQVCDWGAPILGVTER